jgi:hypothetical protein
MTDITRESLDELGAQFHTLMGNAISNWARVEAYLFKICRAALGATSQRTAIVYDASGQCGKAVDRKGAN